MSTGVSAASSVSLDTLSRLKGIETTILCLGGRFNPALDTLSRLKGIETLPIRRKLR